MKIETFSKKEFRILQLIDAIKKEVLENDGEIVVTSLANHTFQTPNHKPFIATTTDGNGVRRRKEVTHTSWIDFVLDDCYYYIEIPENCFQPIRLQKAPLKETARIFEEVYGDDTTLSDEYKRILYQINEPTEDQWEGTARRIIHDVKKSRYSEIAYEQKAIDVPNIYNEHTHVEIVKQARLFNVYPIDENGDIIK